MLFAGIILATLLMHAHRRMCPIILIIICKLEISLVISRVIISSEVSLNTALKRHNITHLRNNCIRTHWAHIWIVSFRKCHVILLTFCNKYNFMKQKYNIHLFFLCNCNPEPRGLTSTNWVWFYMALKCAFWFTRLESPSIKLLGIIVVISIGVLLTGM